MSVRRPKVFLSSTFREDFGSGLETVALRRRILEAAEVLPISLWAYEHIWSGARPEERPLEADMIVDRCFAGIRSCDLFVFILTGRHGSGAAFLDDNVTASYLELELFAAAVLHKPILVLHYKGREPEPALSDTLSLLKHALGAGAYVVDDERALFDHFCDICRALADDGVNDSNRAAGALPEGLSRWRTRPDLQTELSDPRLLFIDGKFHSAKRDVDVDKAKALIGEVAAGVRGKDATQRLIPHGAALFR